MVRAGTRRCGTAGQGAVDSDAEYRAGMDRHHPFLSVVFGGHLFGDQGSAECLKSALPGQINILMNPLTMNIEDATIFTAFK